MSRMMSVQSKGAGSALKLPRGRESRLGRVSERPRLALERHRPAECSFPSLFLPLTASFLREPLPTPNIKHLPSRKSQRPLASVLLVDGTRGVRSTVELRDWTLKAPGKSWAKVDRERQETPGGVPRNLMLDSLMRISQVQCDTR